MTTKYKKFRNQLRERVKSRQILFDLLWVLIPLCLALNLVKDYEHSQTLRTISLFAILAFVVYANYISRPKK